MKEPCRAGGAAPRPAPPRTGCPRRWRPELYIYTHTYMHTYIYIYTYVYIERER